MNFGDRRDHLAAVNFHFDNTEAEPVNPKRTAIEIMVKLCSPGRITLVKYDLSLATVFL